jgi:hypothetical protein
VSGITEHARKRPDDADHFAGAEVPAASTALSIGPVLADELLDVDVRVRHFFHHLSGALVPVPAEPVAESSLSTWGLSLRMANRRRLAGERLVRIYSTSVS